MNEGKKCLKGRPWKVCWRQMEFTYMLFDRFRCFSGPPSRIFEAGERHWPPLPIKTAPVQLSCQWGWLGYFRDHSVREKCVNQLFKAITPDFDFSLGGAQTTLPRTQDSPGQTMPGRTLTAVEPRAEQGKASPLESGGRRSQRDSLAKTGCRHICAWGLSSGILSELVCVILKPPSKEGEDHL